ncbi:hypothetical protein ABS71_02665 [bacterium SCN 62-11]|nr:PD-(D/E)XK nuclease family protein [Candidatus Eremiobacteraeota bacterium]ODT77285.1 MAG: hypothetical protein ABS71_02665 [bacterium SCN 62-11]
MMQRARDFLNRQAAHRPLLIVSPSRAISEELTRPREATFGWYRLSWQQLVERLTRKRPLSRLARWATLQKLLRLQPPDRFAEVSRYPGFSLCLERSLHQARLYELEHPVGLELPPDYDEVDLLQAEWDEEWLRGMGALLVVGLSLDSPHQQRLLNRLRELIPNHLVLQPEPLHRPKVETLSAPDEALECQEIARQLLRAAERGTRWEEMAVLLRQPEVYRASLQSAMRRARIPAFFAESAQSPNPQGRALLSLLECARENLSALRFAEYLSLARQLKTPYRWEELLGAAWVIRTPERWRQRLQGLGQERRQQIAQLQRDEPESPKILYYQDELEQLRQLEGFALPLIERMAGWQRSRSWGEWLSEILALAHQCLVDPEVIEEKLEELQPLRDIPDVPLSEVVTVLAPELSQLTVPPKGHRYGKVLIGSLQEARGREFELVILPGMAERRFPPPIQPDPLLGDVLLQRQLAEERLAIDLALGCGRRVCASYPRQDQQNGRPLLPSATFLELSGAPTYQQSIQAAAANGCLTPAWPAPPDPAQAVDREEHALSWFLRLRAEARAGSAHFLLRLSPFLAQAMRSRMRMERTGWTRADGRVSQPCPESSWPNRRPFSPSTLQKFAVCPYQFWLYSAYRLGPRDRPRELEEMDPLTRGNFVHAVHARLVWRGPADLDTQLSSLREESAQVAREYAELLCPLVPRIFQDEVNQLTHEMEQWLRATYEPGWQARYAELAFQLSDDLERDPASRPQPADLGHGYRMRGSIDRIEINGQGQLKVVDLKTGRNKIPQVYRLARGEALQPVLYALAVEQALDAPVVESRLDFMTLRGNFSQSRLSEIGEARALLYEALGALQQSMQAGHLPAYPKVDGCRYCDYRGVCGPEAQSRARRKPPSTVTQAVDRWREMP